MKLLKHQDITGSDDTVYMTRWIIFQCRWFSIRIHKFVRDDHDVPHDHPWSFVSLILKGGYYETQLHGEHWGNANQFQLQSTSWYGPGSLLFRKAETKHKVALDYRMDLETGEQIGPPLPCWTLCLTGPKVRDWDSGVPRVGWSGVNSSLEERDSVTKFPTPAEATAHSTARLSTLAESILLAAVAACRNWSGDPREQILVKFPAATTKAVLDYVKTFIEASGWKVEFYNGQRDQNIDGTYNMGIKKA